MEKDYNVDDILLEIKSRKSREKAGSPPGGAEPTAAGEPGLRPQGAPEEFRFVPPDDPAGGEGDGATAEGGGEGFFFDHLQEKEPAPPQNPMDFTGHVRPLTDRARIRGSRAGAQPGRPPAAQRDPGFTPPVDPPPEDPQGRARVEHVDFGAFRPQDTKEHTRILPRFPTGEDVGAEDLRRDGIGAAAAGDYSESYYEEELSPDELPGHARIDFSEYNSVGDRRDVATDIARVKLWLFIRMGVTAVLTAAIFYLAMAGKYVMPLPAAIDPVPETMRGYMIACTAVCALVALVNSSAVGGGIISLFKARANSDTLASLALLAAVAQGVVGTVNPDGVDPTRFNLYFCVAVLAMFCGTLGKMTMINRIQTNFRLIASASPKKALLRVDNDDFCREFVPDAVARRPTIAYGVRADFFTDFLGLSYSDKYDVGINRAVAPVCLLGAVLVGAVSYVLAGDLSASVSALTAVLCVSATLSATFIENIPLGKLTKSLHPLGGMVSGNKAVEDFCDTEAVVLTENDLFPEGHVRLRGIKSFSQGRIDEAILDAASVICALDGALTPVFLQMIGGDKRLLRKVDNIVYENGMGVSAWVASRRVLIGNRQLMTNHGVALPPQERGGGHFSAPEEGEAIYLSNSGEVSARFAVSYHIDEDLAAQLDILAAREKTLIVYTCDANITPHRIWELYGYPEDLIRILPAERHTQYRGMIQPRDNAIAEIVCTDGATAMIASLIACMNARGSILSATVLQLVQIVLGYGLVAFMSFMGAIGSLTILQLCVYQVFWFLAIFIVQKAKQP